MISFCYWADFNQHFIELFYLERGSTSKDKHFQIYYLAYTKVGKMKLRGSFFIVF